MCNSWLSIDSTSREQHWYELCSSSLEAITDVWKQEKLRRMVCFGGLEFFSFLSLGLEFALSWTDLLNLLLKWKMKLYIHRFQKFQRCIPLRFLSLLLLLLLEIEATLTFPLNLLMQCNACDFQTHAFKSNPAKFETKSRPRGANWVSLLGPVKTKAALNVVLSFVRLACAQILSTSLWRCDANLTVAFLMT